MKRQFVMLCQKKASFITLRRGGLPPSLTYPDAIALLEQAPDTAIRKSELDSASSSLVEMLLNTGTTPTRVYARNAYSTILGDHRVPFFELVDRWQKETVTRVERLK